MREDHLRRIYSEHWNSWNPRPSNEPARVLEELRDRRWQLRMPQTDLAILAEVSPRFIHDLERGKSTVQLSKVLAVATVLRLELTWQQPRGRIMEFQ
ncbi:MAG: helix-turn-helix domain-containing protein [Trueperaceae bacterium]